LGNLASVGDSAARVGVEVGDGLVARFGDALVLVVEPGSHREGTEEVLEAVETAASGAGSPGAVIAAKLAAIVAGRHPGGLPAFGVVAPLEDTYVLLLHGPVTAEVTGTRGVERLSGQQAVTWVDHRLEVPIDRLSVGDGDHPVQVDPMSDLRAGLVPGSGFVFTPARVTTGAPEPAAGQAEPAPGQGQPAAGARPAVRETQVPMEPVTSFPAEASRPRATPTEAAPAAESDASSRPQPSNRATEALSPPVGHLVAPDGLRIPLDRAYVFGREPETDPAVTSGAATPVRLADDDSISRVHSYVTVEKGQVSLRDASSANGTYVAAPGDETWARVGDEATVLPPTWSVRLGNRVFTYVVAADGL